MIYALLCRKFCEHAACIRGKDGRTGIFGASSDKRSATICIPNKLCGRLEWRHLSSKSFTHFPTEMQKYSLTLQWHFVFTVVWFPLVTSVSSLKSLELDRNRVIIFTDKAACKYSRQDMHVHSTCPLGRGKAAWGRRDTARTSDRSSPVTPCAKMMPAGHVRAEVHKPHVSVWLGQGGDMRGMEGTHHTCAWVLSATAERTPRPPAFEV